MLIFVVHMYRWGDPDAHSYVEGVYTSKEEAVRHGQAEMQHRAGKYEPEVWAHELNKPRMAKYMTDEEIDARMDSPEARELIEAFKKVCDEVEE